MTQKAETRVVNAIRKALEDRYGSQGKWIKLHGSAMQERGLPDVIGCLAGRFLAIEVKVPGEAATPLQAFRLEQFALAGATTAVVESVAEALAIAASVLPSSAPSSGLPFELADRLGHASEDRLVQAKGCCGAGQPRQEDEEQLA